MQKIPPSTSQHVSTHPFQASSGLGQRRESGAPRRQLGSSRGTAREGAGNDGDGDGVVAGTTMDEYYWIMINLLVSNILQYYP